MNQLKETGTVEKQKSTGRPRTWEEDAERIRQSRIRSPKISIARRSVTLGIPKTTIQNVRQKRLRPHAYKIQLKREIQLTTDQNVSNLPLSCSAPLMKTKRSYSAFVFRTRQHFI